ncbi:hypothetical protein SAMN05660653_03062 [Desulfonatronum thiosulfatophilum]|uniref:Uncharacterized protein n=2 Tax=Desulfonatronum thiosulfatophilum TaxID=617002 RepID=A0A1G6EST8_9BACT|nr:hypothetical protein SAMN05660653_03062 [Desulfonatronum thiosulfatophilum]
MQQALTAQVMKEALQREREKIAELRKTQESHQVRPEDEHGSGRGHRHPRDQRSREQSDQEPMENNDPWSGQIVNIKV